MVITIYNCRKLIPLLLIFFLVKLEFTYAQDTKKQKSDTIYWSNTGSMGLTISNVQLNNWKAGGENSLTINLHFNKIYKYEKDKHLLTTLFESFYGLQKQGATKNPFKKIDDLIHLNTLYGHKMYKKWYLGYNLDLRTQWFNGEETKNLDDGKGEREVIISSFMSPGFIVSGLSFTYKHNFDKKDFFIVNIFPISNFKLTTISDQSIFNGYKTGEKVFGIEKGKSTHFEWGLLTIGSQLQKSISKNITLNSNLTLFTPVEKAGNFDVNFDVIINSQINKWLGVNWTYNLVYDDDVSTKIQSKWTLGIGLNMKL